MAAWEWSSLMQLKSFMARLSYVVLIFFISMWAFSLSSWFVYSLALIWWLCALFLVLQYPAAQNWNNYFWQGVMGALVLAPCFKAINDLRMAPHGIFHLLFLFVLIWGADSAAYFVGRRFGKHKLLPEVSPGKTREGAIGALLFALLVTLFALYFSPVAISKWPYLVILACVTVLFSILGDLLESMLKRQAGLKDSGRLFPGHGGLLDRIDSLTAAAPIFVLGFLLLAKLSWILS